MRRTRLLWVLVLIGGMVIAGGLSQAAPAFAQQPQSGDLDGNGCVDQGDQRRLLTALVEAQLRGNSQPPSPAYDLDGDGRLTARDAARLPALFTNLGGTPCASGGPPAGPARWPFSSIVGVNYSRAFAANPLPVAQAMQKIKQNYGIVKLYGNDPNLNEALAAAQSNGLEVALGTLNSQIAQFQTLPAAQSYVNSTIVPYRNTIKLVIVGNEPFLSNSYSGLLVALTNVKTALLTAGLGSMPVTIAESIVVIDNSYPPDCGIFRSQYMPALRQVLAYLASINSFILLDAYPYHAIRDNPVDIPLAYALGTQGQSIPAGCGAPATTEPSLFQAMLDAFKAAIGKLNVPSLPVYIGEVGWASGGGPPVATVANQQTFMNTFRSYASANSIGSFLFEMFDENNKPGPADERFYGLFKEDGTAK